MSWFKIMLWFCCVVVFVLSFVVFVSADFEVNRTIVLNESGLPVNGSEVFSFGLLPYENFNVSLLNVNNNFDFVFDSFIAMGNYSLINWSFNYSVHNFSVVEDFSEVFVFELINSMNDDSLFVNFNVSVLNDVFVVENVSESWSVVVINGSRFVNVSKNVLPLSGELDYVLGGVSGENVSIDCGRFLSCPGSGVFDGDGFISFSAGFFLPINLSVGVYDSGVVFGFAFNGSNYSLSYPVSFVVNPVEYNFLNNLSLDSDCYNLEGFIDPACMDDVYNFLNEGFERYMSVCEDRRVDAYDDGWDDCEDQIEPELVVTGSLDSAVFDSWEICKVERDGYKGSLDDCRGDLGGWRSKFFVINETLLSERQGFVDGLRDCNVAGVVGFANCSAKFSAFEKKVNRENWRVVVVPSVIVLLGLLVYYVILWRRKNVDKNLGW